MNATTKLLIALVLLVGALFVAWYVLSPSPAPETTNTPEVLGEENATEGEEYREARLGESVSALGLTITPLEVLEDSRCPQGVQCVWEGTVRLRANVTSSAGMEEKVLVLNNYIAVGELNVVLAGVSPAPKEGVTIAPSDYRFTILITSYSFNPGAKL